MKSAIVDNSTITAVQRLTGSVSVQKSFSIEGDISAYDQYLQAILLYDRVALVDDYKDEFKVSRSSEFSELVFLRQIEKDYAEASSLAASICEDVYLKVRGGDTEKGLVKDLLETIDLHVSPAWYLQSSDWFLRLRLLSDHAGVNLPKYGALMTCIFDQLSQNSKALRPIRWAKDLLSRTGREVPDSSGEGKRGAEVVNGDVKAFAAGLNWLTERSVFYLLLCHRMDAACVTHPIRHTFLANFFAKELEGGLTPNIRATFLETFSSDAAKAHQARSRMIGRLASVAKLPFFAGWAVAHTGDPRRGREHVLDVRDSSEGITLRSRFREIEAALDNEVELGLRELGKLYQALEEANEGIKRKFKRASDDDLNVSISLTTASVSISSKSASRRIRSFLPNSDKRALAILRNISADIVRVPTMRDTADAFSHSLNYDQASAYRSHEPKVDPFRYARSRLDWKRPMD
jgi:hypothetical protein